MNELPPILREQRKIDADHLNLLSVLHFLGAGFALLAMLFLVEHFVIFHAFFANPIFNNPKMWPDQMHGPPSAEMLAVFKWFYLIFGSWLLASGVLNLVSGFFLRARKHRTFSMVVGAVNCLHLPLGTVLGVFTIVVLMRDSVRELYDARSGAGVGPPP